MTKTVPYQIKIESVAHYVSNQMHIKQGIYLFAYTITISNLDRIGIRLLTRHWIITDQVDNIQEVRGRGVVGEQPFIAAGESYRYSSSAVIKAPIGHMTGHYAMVTDGDDNFEVEIPKFQLIAKYALN